MEQRREAISLKVEDGIALVTIDVPGEPVNTLSPEFAKEFEAVLGRLEKEAGVRAVIFVSGKKDSFIAGAKLDFLATLTSAEDAEAISRRAQQGFDRLEKLGKPTVAAIDGACLGGGLEFALACGYRIATDSPKTSLGLPEVQLGLIPGAGGTQRLPRLIGIQAGLDLILTGRTLKPKRALKAGVVDEVVPAPILLEVAVRRASELASGERSVQRGRAQPGRGAKGFLSPERVSELALEGNPLGRAILFDQARRQVRKKSRGKYPAPEKALEAVRIGIEEGMEEEGLQAEAERFGALAVSEVSRRLVEIFFATTALKKETGVSDPNVKPRAVKKLGILGGGLMGGGIAYVTAAHVGIPVRLKERDDAGVARALKHVRGTIDERVKRRSITWREAEAQLARVTAGTDYSGFRGAELVIEAVFEDLTLKQSVLEETERVTSDECIFASNTSSIPIARIAEASRRPHTVIGMHYFSPVEKMPLLEVIAQPKTADWVVATCVEVGKRQGKTVIVVNDGPGFYTTRILAPYMNEAAFLLGEGADIAELDAALVDFGFPVGPITLLDEVGIDVGAKVGKVLHQAFGERFAPPPVTERLLADGRLGRKSKKGFYTYDGKKKQVDETVYGLYSEGRRKKLDPKEMAERCVLQFVNEAIRCLGEGILRSARDGDIGAIFGLGFPPFLGGPFRYADALGPAKLLERLEHLRGVHGARFEPAPELVERARDGRRFHARAPA